jgi:hypothetical protein
VVEFEQHRLHRADDERERDEQQGHADAPLGVLQMEFHRTSGPVERQHHQARHDGGQRERQVDHRVDEPLAAELVAGEHPRHQKPEDRVDHRHADRDGQGHPKGFQRGAGGDRREEGRPTALGGLPHDGGQRQQDDHAEPDRRRTRQKGCGPGPPVGDNRPARVVGGLGPVDVGVGASRHPVAFL